MCIGFVEPGVGLGAQVFVLLTCLPCTDAYPEEAHQRSDLGMSMIVCGGLDMHANVHVRLLVLVCTCALLSVRARVCVFVYVCV